MASFLQLRLRDVTLVALAIASLVSFSAGGDGYRCPPSGWTAGHLYIYGEKCYQFILDEKTWVDARSYCYSKGAALMNLENQAKQNWAVSTLSRIGFTNNGFWLGLHDKNTEGRWEWDEGPGAADVPMGWSNWASGEPNDWTGQDCVYMRRQYGFQWVDVGCGDGFHVNRNYGFACEYKILPEMLPETTTGSATESTSSKPALHVSVVPPESPHSGDLQDSDGKGKIAGTGQVVGASQQQGDGDKAAHISIGLLAALLIAVAIIVLLVFKRRRDKKNMGPAHSLANPCYVDTAGTNNLDCDDENGYAVCRIQPNGNVYVEMGDENIPAPSVKSAKDDVKAFSNQRYMAAPTRASEIDISNAENSANDLKLGANPKPERKSKYLDECGTYTDDGYLAPKHIYADISDIVVPPASLVPTHYDVPEAVRSSQVSSTNNENMNVYEDPQAIEHDSEPSPNYTNIPLELEGHYDIPRRSQEVASEYAMSDSSESDNVDPPPPNPQHYDTPKHNLKGYVDTECSV